MTSFLNPFATNSHRTNSLTHCLCACMWVRARAHAPGVRLFVRRGSCVLLWWPSVHQSPERVSARHLVCLSASHFLCLCVCLCVCAAPSLCLLALPLRHCVCARICSLSPSLSNPTPCPLISVLLGWSPRPWISYFWRFLLWKDYSLPSSV